MLLAAPLAVVGSSSDWWFLGSGPKRATPVAVLESGSWSGQAWTLTAFRAENGGICWSVDAGKASSLRFGGRFFVIHQPDDPAILIDHVGGYAGDGRLIACIDMQRLRIQADLAACMR